MSLQEILARKRIDIENELLGRFMKDMERKAFSMRNPKNFYSALAVPGLSVITEVKKASPSKGIIARDLNCTRIALEYKGGGAEAISVLYRKTLLLWQ
jgi:indole-3-glycerol phosphate synthase